MDQQPAPQKSFTKPVGGFIVVLIAALLIGGFLYVDMVKNELEQKVDDLSAELEAAKEKERAEAEKAPEPAVQEEAWQTYSAELGGRRFQIDLPPGYRLSADPASASEFMYVMPPAEEGELPAMTITTESSATVEMSEQRDGRKLVKAGDVSFWFALWEDMEWEPFARVVASFKAL